MFGPNHAEAFWPLAVLPLVVGTAAVVTATHPSVAGVAGLAALTGAAGLGEAIVWRGLRSKWAGERDSLWPWSERLRTVAIMSALWFMVVAAGAVKAHGNQGGTWPEAVRYSALIFGGLAAFYAAFAAIERVGRGPH